MRVNLFAGTAGCALAVAVAGQAAPLRVAFDLPRQPAAESLQAFARQAGLQFLAPADSLRGVMTPALHGVMDVRRALDLLIAGTGLEVVSFDGRVFVLRRQPPPPPAPAPPGVLRAERAAQPAAAVELDGLAVIGGGQARQVQLVRGQDIERLPPGSGPLELVARLPSVNLTSADPLGANEWSTRFSVRNFNQGRLGFTLDDIPLGDMTYGNHNGLHVSRAITGENLGSVELTAGPGALEVASSSNLGGTVKFRSRDPAPLAGATIALAAGSDETSRLILRLDSGDLAGGLRGYASYAVETTRRWQGAGRQGMQQVNVKLVRPVGDGALTLLADLSRRRESDPQDLSLDMARRLGVGWDNVPGDWPLAVRLAEIAANRGDTSVARRHPEVGTVYPAPITSVDDAYFDSTTARDDALVGLGLRIPLSPRVAAQALAYGHWDRGQGLWWTPYVASPNYGVVGAEHDDAPLSVRSTEYDIRRRGVLASTRIDLGRHRLSAGVWLEANNFVQARRFYGLDLAAPQRDYRHFQTGAFRTDWAYHFETQTRQAFIEDSWRLGDDLVLTGGFKALSVQNRAITRVGENKDGEASAASPFLPRLGLRWRPSPSDEVFVNYGRGMRAFASSNTSGPFAGSAAAVRARRTKLKPEVSDSYEVGWRRTGPEATWLVAAYDAHFRNRLFSTPVGGGILGNPLVLANVGGVSSYGVETLITRRLSPAWTAQAAYSYSRATYDDDVFDGDGVRIARTRGKLAVDAPQHLLRGQLTYRRGGGFAQLAASYVGARFFTFENDQHVPGELLVDLSAGYRFNAAPFDGVTALVNVTNLFDRRYISTVGSNDFPIRGDAQTLLAGPPRQVFVTLRKDF